MAMSRKAFTPAAKPPVSSPASIAPAPVAEQVAVDAAPAAAAGLRDSADAVLAQVRDAQESVRKSAEQGIEKSREAYARLKGEAEVATGSLEASFAAARAGVQSLNAKAFEALQTQTQASFDHAKALFSVTAPQDAMSLQTEFARKQFEAFSAQTKEFSALWQKLAKDAFEPLKQVATRPYQA